MSMVPGETCFNLNFSDPGSNSPLQSILLTPKQTSSSGAMEDNFEQCSPRPQNHQHQIHDATPTLPNGKKTKGRVKIKMEYIGNKLRRYTTFSKRKTGIMKKAYELSTLTGTQVMLLVASETGHVYTFATKKLQPMISSEAGKTLIQNCLNTPDLDETTDPLGSRHEFTFEPHQNSSKKRKLNECVELPTMVHPASANTTNGDTGNSDGNSESGDESHEALDEAEADDKQKEQDRATSLSLQQTLKEALRVAAAQRQLQKKKAKSNSQTNISLLTPFLLPATDNSSFFSNPDNQPVNPQFLFPMNSLTLQQNLLQMMSAAALNAQLENADTSS